MEIINTTNINQARKLIQKLKKENPNIKIVVQAQDSEFNRKILESKNVDILLSPELHNKKDYLKQRNSGLNEVLCRLAAKNNVKIGIDLKKIQKLPKKEKARVLSRIIQNIKLCRRTKTQIIILGRYKKQDITSFFQTSRASTKQAKEGFISY